jgi:hypothetical protein
MNRPLRFVSKTEQHELVPAKVFDRNVKAEIGERSLLLADLPTFPLDRLSRYEHLLRRQRQLLFTLETLILRAGGVRFCLHSNSRTQRHQARQSQACEWQRPFVHYLDRSFQLRRISLCNGGGL